MKRLLCLTFATVIFLLTNGFVAVDLVNAQSQSQSQPEAQAQPQPQSQYQSYKEIPGVTREDIKAVDALLAEKPRLVYGFCLSTEAYLEEDGSVGGFAALFCDRLSQLFGFEFDFYQCNFEDLGSKMMAKEIDLTGELTATPQRLQIFMMTDTIAQRTVKIFSNRNDSDLRIIAETRPIRCAFLEGSTTYSHVESSWDMPFDPVFVPGVDVVPDMLLNGQIDAFIEEGMLEAIFDAYNFIQIEDYYPITYSSISLAAANPQMAPIINVMQKYLENGGYDDLSELYNQGYGDYLKYKLFKQFTPEEKAYIQKHIDESIAVTAAFEVDNYPTSFYNTQEKEFQGVALDVLQQVSALTGLSFQVGNGKDASWPELLEGLETGEYVFITELLQTNPRKNRFLWTEVPYYIDYYAMISKTDYPDTAINRVEFTKVGLLEDMAYTDVFKEWFPRSTNTITYQNKDEAIAALEKGEIDLLMVSQNFLLHLTNYLEKPRFKTNVVFPYSVGSFFGFNKDEELLCSIVNKAQQYIDTEGIANSWQRKVFDYQSKMLRDMFPYMVIFVTALTAALAIVICLFVKNKHISRNLEKIVVKRTNELAVQTSTLTTIFESIPDLIFCKDANFQFTRCNKSFEEYFGWSESDIIGKEDSAAIGITDREAAHFRSVDEQVMQECRAIIAEEYIPAVNGAPQLFETIRTPLVQDGDVVGIMGISRDITQRKAAEETLKRTLDSLNTCIYISEIETGEILFMNQMAIDEFGCEDFRGKTCRQVIRNGPPERCSFCPIPKLLESGDTYYIWENKNPVTGKHYKHMDNLIKWHDGRLVHLQHLVDITHFITLQQDLESASKAKSDFLSRMSHEIRTPLNAIIGMIGIAMNSDDKERIEHCLDRADNASKHLLGVINDILDMSKIEADKFVLDRREFDFEQMLVSVTNVVNFRVEEKKQNFVVKLGENVPASIIGDDLRLAQVITNLLTNAVKFTPEGGTVTLSIEKIEDLGDEVTLQLEIVDNGIGISKEQQSRLFSSFEQADGGIARKFGGTGLGLAISKRIMELMGGRIWIESELGKGAKFIVTMKAGKGKERSHARLSGKISKEELRIMAVDDSPEVLEYFAQVMASLGLSCDVAVHGHQAIELIQACGNKPYNIFFIDWMMSEMDGIQLTKKIKEIAPANSVVFMISVVEWSNIEKEAIAAGVHSFISKPLFPSSLVDAINGCIETPQKRAVNSSEDFSDWGQMKFDGHAILIAEDIEINREIMSAVLEDTGISIDYAENGLLAVAMFEENPDKYSLIFMDIHMPEMGGYEATRAIRALNLPQAKTIPIVAMTANVFKEDIDNCLAAGMNNHIGKPIDHQNLFSKLQQYLVGSKD